MSVLEVRHVYKSFTQGLVHQTKTEVLHDISFTVEENEILGLAGTSGAGKSTLIRVIMQLLPWDQGEILFEGNPLGPGSHKAWKEVAKDMQLVFQNPASALNPHMTIRELMEEPLRIHGKKEEDAVFSMFERMQLRSELLSRYPYQLSGGELQRVAMGRLLLLRPKLLLLDEPTSMLDVSVQAQVISLLQDIRKEHPMACLFISHDLDLLHAICHRIGIMKEGRLIEIQETESLYAHPQEAYTGELIQAFEEF